MIDYCLSLISVSGSNAVPEDHGPGLFADYTQISDKASYKDTVIKMSRAHHVCIELFETDVSYVSALKLLSQVRFALHIPCAEQRFIYLF